MDSNVLSVMHGLSTVVKWTLKGVIFKHFLKVWQGPDRRQMLPCWPGQLPPTAAGPNLGFAELVAIRISCQNAAWKVVFFLMQFAQTVDNMSTVLLKKKRQKKGGVWWAQPHRLHFVRLHSCTDLHLNTSMLPGATINVQPPTQMQAGGMEILSSVQ